MEKKINTPALKRLLIFVSLIACWCCCKAQNEPLPNGFAHNDYKHRHPLFDALDNGFTNIEADVFVRDTTLVVAHISPMFRHSHTLEKLYLKPLYDRVMQNSGRVYPKYDHPIILMIDIKSNADNTYRELERELSKYSAILTSYHDGIVVDGAVTVVLSGHKPYKMLESEGTRLAFIDEDLRRVQRDPMSTNIFTMASCKYSKLLSWDGKGPIPVWQERRLRDFVAMAHRLGSKVRLWASPDRKAVWDELLSCGVDLINTDHLSTLRNYLNSGHITYAKAE